uniref:Uncharacterized protein n=1 Tax=Avena sativa TaxID=4498 RepID=A0ACD5X866_AVESA
MKRQFINLVLDSCSSGGFTLRRIKSSSLFQQSKRGGRSTTAVVEEAELPEPALSFGPFLPRHREYVLDKRGSITSMPFGGSAGTIFAPFGLDKNKIVNADQKGNVVVYDTCEEKVCGMPRLKGCMANSIPINMGDALYIIKRCPEKPYEACFQALIHGEPPEDVHESPGWHWHSLRPPPYVEAPGYEPSCDFEITSLVVLGKSILVSAGMCTYRFDTTGHEWSELGSWDLPFHGAAQYVHELLGRWVGFSAQPEDQFLCVWDSGLSACDAPTRCRVWSQREDLAIPEDWELLSSDLVRVDYGRFCIARSFLVYEDLDCCRSVKEKFMVLTGIELGKYRDADGGIGMIKHTSIRYNFSGYTTYWVF